MYVMIYSAKPYEYELILYQKILGLSNIYFLPKILLTQILIFVDCYLHLMRSQIEGYFPILNMNRISK